MPDGNCMSAPSVLFVLNDSNLSGIDCRDVTQGNPGVGGAEYLFVALAWELVSRGLAKVTLAHFSASNLYPDILPTIRLPQPFDAPWQSGGPEAAVDFVVVRAYNMPTMAKVIEAVPGSAPIIVWTHNHLHWKTYSYLAQCERVRCVVYVGREQAVLAMGTPCRAKATFIVNGFYPPPAVEPQPRSKRAVYVGSLVPQKGFHRLAKLWPRIFRECPDAVLDVIGDGRVYASGNPVGPLGLTAPEYEKRIMEYLDNDPARYGVVFHGKLGLSKFEIMSRAVLGLPNPTGFSECCPGSVLELSACGNAVVAPRRWGMCDTVLDGVSGYLCTTDDEYVRTSVALLKDPARALDMGRAGQAFVAEKFGFRSVCDEWHALFTALQRGESLAEANPGPLKGSYPLQPLRMPANGRVPVWGELVNHFDRAHGWILTNF
jgi:glycosyltransferase involved in cell wall biosynthesis